MKRPIPNRRDAVRNESNEYFLDRTSVDEELDKQDTYISNPEASPYYPANSDPDFKPKSYIKET